MFLMHQSLNLERNVLSENVELGGAAGLEDVFQYDEQNVFLKVSVIHGFENQSPVRYGSQFCVINFCSKYNY